MKNDNLPLLGGQLVTSYADMTEEDFFGEVRELVHGDWSLDEARPVADEAWRREQAGHDRCARYLRDAVARGNKWLGFTPRDWQVEAIEVVRDALAKDKRGLVRATTGSGKSLLQAEVIAELVANLQVGERIVVSAPTQKLVAQLGDTLERRCPGMVGRYYQYNKEIHRPIIVVCHASLWDGVILCPECHDIKPGPAVRELEGNARERARCSFNEAAIGGDFRHCEQSFTHTRAIAVTHRLTAELLGADLTVRYWISDECHKTECDQVLGFANLLKPVQAIGFTATPWRASEEESLTLFDELLYDYGPSRAIQDGVVIHPSIVSYQGDQADLNDACLEMIENHLSAHPGPGVVSAESIEDADRYANFLCNHGIPSESIHSKISKDEQARRIAKLQAGEIQALVHVCLLAEGVDLPWLEWLCMRRSSVSRVRFVQEVGRVLRTCEGKSKAWVFDPHDLFGRLSLDYTAVLGGESDIDEGPQAELDALAREVAALFEEEESTPRGATGVTGWVGGGSATGLDLVRSWLRRTALGYRLAGHAELKVDSTSWRTHPATEKQLSLVGYIIRKRALTDASETMDESQRLVMRESLTAARAGDLNRGDVSDLITILKVLEDARSFVRLEEIEEVAA